MQSQYSYKNHIILNNAWYSISTHIAKYIYTVLGSFVPAPALHNLNAKIIKLFKIRNSEI